MILVPRPSLPPHLLAPALVVLPAVVSLLPRLFRPSLASLGRSVVLAAPPPE